MASTSMQFVAGVRKPPFEVWLSRELTRLYAVQDTIPENLRRLAEKLAESQSKMGCANHEGSAKPGE